MSRHILASVMTATLIAGAAAPAFADQRPIIRSAEVDISGIDLTTDAGARTVLKRIERTAARVCGVYGGVKTLPQMRVEKACMDDAVENAINSMVDRPAQQAALRAIRGG